MAGVTITGKPDKQVTSLKTPVRGSGNRTMSTSWKVPASMTKESNKKRAEHLSVEWKIYAQGLKNTHHSSGNMAYNDYILLSKEKSVSTTTASLNLDNISAGNKTYTRSSFYPNKKVYLKSVTVMVAGTNSKGEGKDVSATREFKAPKKPTIDAFSFNTSTGACTTVIRTDAGTGYKERYDTKYKVVVKNTATNTTTTPTDTSNTGTEINISYDPQGYASLTYDQYISITVSAFARGYAGDSETVTKTLYVSRPAIATIKDVSVSSKDSTGRLTVSIDTNATTQHPVDTVKLEYLRNVTYEEAEDIPASEESNWEDSGIEDNGKCTALAMPVGKLIPDRGKHSWIRVKTIHLHEGVLYEYSNYKRLDGLETPAAEAPEDDIKILSVGSGADAKSAVVQLGWNVSGTDNSTGTELTWADEEDTWKSTKEPDKHEFTWSDGTYTYDGVTYHDSAKITIKDLTEGERYFIKARRYLEEESTSYGNYSNTATIIPNGQPAGVVASCSDWVAEGEPLQVYWTFGGGLQTAWQIAQKTSVEESFTGNGTNKVFTVSNEVASVTSVKVNGTATTAYTRNGQTFTFNSAPANGRTVLITYDAFTTVIAKGEGSITGTQISADSLQAHAVNNQIVFNVLVSTGSGFIASEQRTVRLIPKPTLTLNAPATLTSQSSTGYTFTASSSRLCDLVVIVTSQGISGQRPEGFMSQINGDTIHSDIYSPAWSSGSASVSLPTNLDFWDGGDYTLSVVAVDRETGLKTEAVEATFSINWSPKAKDPDSYVTVTPIDVAATESTEHIQGVQITLSAPSGSATSDVYDIYRMNGGVAYLIGQDFPRSGTFTDKYAPFGGEFAIVSREITGYLSKNPTTEGWYECPTGIYKKSVDTTVDSAKTYYEVVAVADAPFYRVALRTADGSVEFTDKEYLLPATPKSVRFDWQGGTLELPYGGSIGDNYKKSVEFRQHMDGSVDGYWNQNIERSASYNSSIIKLLQPDEIELARQLARYAGAVYVRTSDGSAFSADVQITDLSVKNEATTAIAIDATEVGLTEEFMLPSPYEQEG